MLLSHATPKMDNTTFTTMTVPQIKEWAKSRGILPPSSLKKDQLIQYVNAKLVENSLGPRIINTNTVTSLDKLVPRYCDTSIDWLVHLHHYGWAVVPIPNWDPNFVNTFFSWFESCCDRFNRYNPETWKTSNMPPTNHGILMHQFGHTEFQWKIRELCVDIFGRIWQCKPEDLLCSFDGGSLLPTNPNKKTFKQWLHTDAFREANYFSSVQGIVNFVDNHLEDGGLVLLENSHKTFSTYMKNNPSEGITWGYANTEDNSFSGSNLIKICAPAGSIILFDSRTFHCNVKPFGSIIKPDGTPRFRMSIYVCMQPRRGADEKQLKRRIHLYETKRLTGHWSYGPWFKERSEKPRTYGKDDVVGPKTVERAELNPLRARLIGY